MAPESQPARRYMSRRFGPQDLRPPASHFPAHQKTVGTRAASANVTTGMGLALMSGSRGPLSSSLYFRMTLFAYSLDKMGAGRCRLKPIGEILGFVGHQPF